MMRHNSYTTPSSRGFTLVELLVVVGIMAAMLSVAAIGIQNIDKGQATVSGVAQVQGLMDEARNLAIGRGTRARLCIHAAPQEEERNLRYMVVAYEEIQRDASGQETGRSWRVDSRGTYLPNSVYFNPQLSQQAGLQVTGLGTYGSGGTGVKFPGDLRSIRNPAYFYYEFNSEGLCSAQDQTNAGAPFVLCRGVLPPTTSQPRVIRSDVGGFIVWRNGRTSPIRDTSTLINKPN